MSVSVRLILCFSGMVTVYPVTRGEAYHREVSFEFNPGRNLSASAPPDLPNLLHVRAVGANDTIHYVWSSLGAPTVLLVYTDSPSSQLSIDWSRLELQDPSGAIRMQPASSVIYSTAIIFSRVLEYNDVNDTADLSQVPAAAFFPAYQLEDLSWDNANTTLNRTQLTAQLRGRNATSQPFGNSSFTFRIAAFESSSRDSVLPRLLHTANSSKLEFVMEGVVPRGNWSRFALEMMVVETAGVQRELRLCPTINDEYTPSIFQMDKLVAVVGNQSSIASFLQWKPVAYSSPSASLATSLPSRDYGLRTGRNLSLPASSIAYAFFGATLPGGAHVTAMNISFGSSGGDLYNSSRYISWSALIGYGEPPEEGFSMLALIVLAVGLGLPVLLLLFGGLSVYVIHPRRHSSSYQPVNSEPGH